jgi:xyloglucan-specific exo-beta-1,4-glucanase
MGNIVSAFTSLLILIVGCYLANVAFNAIAKSGKLQQRALLARLAHFIIIALAAAIAFQQVSPISNVVNLASRGVEVASLNHQKNVTLGERNVAIGGGGYVTGIYLHPQQKDLVYLKTDVGGFYRWNPRNQSWIPLTDHFPREQSNYYGGEALAFDPNNPNIVYIAAGRTTADWWDKDGAIFKSTNRGETWTKLKLELRMGGNDELRWVGERLAVNPSDSQVILFGSRLDGLWRSPDRGQSWKQVRDFPGKLDQEVGITAIAFDKKGSGKVYAIAYKDGIYQSTDAGITWNKIAASPPEAKRLAVASNGVLYVTHDKGVSQYANQRWNDITPLGKEDTFNAISVNPSNPHQIIVCIGEETKSGETKIYQTLDGGTSWKELEKSTNNTVPWWSDYMVSNPWISAIEFDPKVSGRVWFTDWYGIWRTDDITASPVAWTNYQKGHEEIVTFTLLSPPSGPLLISGMADVDGFYHDKGLDHYPSQKMGMEGEASFKDTYSIAYYEANPSRMVRVGYDNAKSIYTGATSTDSGRTWKQFASFPEDKMPLRVAISATNPDLFVVTTSDDRPLRTTDGGKTWKTVSGLPKGPNGPWYWSLPLAADPVDGDVFYYFDDGKVFRSSDGGASFAIANATLPNDRWHSLKTVPGTKGEIWLSLDNKGLYHSIDSGETFNQLDNIKRAYLIAVGKPQPRSTTPALYLYGEIADQGEGIFRSLDRGKSWTRIGDRSRPIGNEPNVMEASKQQFGLVFVGTNGRGIYYGTQ